VRFIYWVLLSLVLILSPLNAAPPLPAQKPVPETKTSPQANPGVQRLAFVGLHGGIFEILKRFEEDYQLQLDYFTDEQLAVELSTSHRIVLSFSSTCADRIATITAS